jgi:hypothetical protein
MTYRQLRLLFAGLARYDGRLSVLTARNDVAVGLWTVVLRDHVRHTWLDIRRIEQLAPDASLGAFTHSARGWFLAGIEASRPARPEPRYRLALQRAGIRYEADSYGAFEQIVAAG